MDTSQTVIHVLLIEDNESDAFLLQESLSQSPLFHFEITLCTHLAAALELLPSGRFDLVLTDLALPDSTGLMTIRAILAAAPSLPIVLLSGNLDENLAFEGVKLGAQDYLVNGSFNTMTLPRVLFYAMERKKIEIFKDEFSGLVSHELRAPLTVIHSALATLKDKNFGALSDKQNKILLLAHKNAVRLGAIINNVLDLAHYESGKVELNLNAVDLKATLQDAMEIMQIEAEKKSIQMIFELPDNLAPIEAEASLLEQVLGNLLSNALRFARRTIKIQVEVAQQELLLQRFAKNRSESPFLHLSIKDDGPGIPRDKIKSLFTKFMQLERRSDSNSYKGTGLGLSLCKTIVSLLKGQIWVESSLGEGAEFHILLPVFQNH